MGANSGAGTSYPSGYLEFIPGLKWSSLFLICKYCPYDYCIVCSLFSGFWLPLWYFQDQTCPPPHVKALHRVFWEILSWN